MADIEDYDTDVWRVMSEVRFAESRNLKEVTLSIADIRGFVETLEALQEDVLEARREQYSEAEERSMYEYRAEELEEELEKLTERNAVLEKAFGAIESTINSIPD